MVLIECNGVDKPRGHQARAHQRRLHALPHPGRGLRHVHPHPACHLGIRLRQLLTGPHVPASSGSRRSRGSRQVRRRGLSDGQQGCAAVASHQSPIAHSNREPTTTKAINPGLTWHRKNTWCVSARRRGPQTGGNKCLAAVQPGTGRPHRLQQQGRWEWAGENCKSSRPESRMHVACQQQYGQPQQNIDSRRQAAYIL